MRFLSWGKFWACSLLGWIVPAPSEILFYIAMIIPERIHFVPCQADFHKNFLRVSYMKQDLLERAIVSFQDIKEYALAKRTVLSWNYPPSTGAFIASSESVWNLQGKSDNSKNYWLISPQGHLFLWNTIFLLLWRAVFLLWRAVFTTSGWTVAILNTVMYQLVHSFTTVFLLLKSQKRNSVLKSVVEVGGCLQLLLASICSKDADSLFTGSCVLESGISLSKTMSQKIFFPKGISA